MIYSRTKNSIVNSIVGMSAYVLVMVATMVTRICFARYLGEELLGLNSLYTSVVQILQISELGISNAIVITLYKPVKEKNKEQIKSIIKLYKTVYNWFAFILLSIGLVVTCFVIPHIVKVETISMIEVQIYFILFLLGIVCSYLFAYTKSMFYAEQKNRVISLVNAGQKVVIGLLQVLSILYFKNYYIYLVLLIAGYLLENLICHFAVLREHPYLNERDVKNVTLEEKKAIVNLIKPIFVLRIADKVLSQSDSLIINSFIDIITLGMYTNYHTIFNACLGLFNPIGAALTSSYGNLSVNASPIKKYEAFRKSYAVFHAVALLFCMLFVTYIQDFIFIAYGEKYVLTISFSIIMTFYLYFTFVKTIYYSYQNALGLHKLDQKQTILQVPFNIVVSIILVLFIGLNGIIVGTIISILIFSVGFKGRYLFEVAFEQKSSKYYLQTLGDTLRSTLCICTCSVVSANYAVTTFSGFIVKVFILFIGTCGLQLIVFITDSNYRYSIKYLMSRLIKKGE